VKTGPSNVKRGSGLGSGLTLVRITAPRVTLLRRIFLHQTGSRRIQIHIIAGYPQLRRSAFIDQHRLIPPAEEMSHHPRAGDCTAECKRPAATSSRQPDSVPASLHHQVEVIAHQAVRMHLPARLLTASCQEFQKCQPVAIAIENPLLPVSPAHHVDHWCQMLFQARCMSSVRRWRRLPPDRVRLRAMAASCTDHGLPREQRLTRFSSTPT